MVCNRCYIPMVSVMSFSKDKHEKYCRCPKCKQETKKYPIPSNELIFRGYLDEAMKRR